MPRTASFLTALGHISCLAPTRSKPAPFLHLRWKVFVSPIAPRIPKALTTKPRTKRPVSILNTTLTVAALLHLTGCLTDGGYDLSNYNGPPFSYVGQGAVVTQKYVYDCKRTKLGGEYCTPKAVGQPYSYDHFIAY